MIMTNAVIQAAALLDKIERLTRELEALHEYVKGPIVYVTDAEITARQAQRDRLLAIIGDKEKLFSISSCKAGERPV